MRRWEGVRVEGWWARWRTVGVMSDGEEGMMVPGNVLSIFIHYFV